MQSEPLELASREVGAFAPGPGAAQLEERAVTCDSVWATPKPSGSAGGWRRAPGTALALALGSSQPQPPCDPGPRRGEEGRPQHQTDPFWSGLLPNLTFSLFWTQQLCPLGPHSSASSCGLVVLVCCPGREAVSLVPRITGFSLG